MWWTGKSRLLANQPIWKLSLPRQMGQGCEDSMALHLHIPASHGHQYRNRSYVSATPHSRRVPHDARAVITHVPRRLHVPPSFVEKLGTYWFTSRFEDYRVSMSNLSKGMLAFRHANSNWYSVSSGWWGLQLAIVTICLTIRMQATCGSADEQSRTEGIRSTGETVFIPCCCLMSRVAMLVPQDCSCGSSCTRRNSAYQKGQSHREPALSSTGHMWIMPKSNDDLRILQVTCGLFTLMTAIPG